MYGIVDRFLILSSCLVLMWGQAQGISAVAALLTALTVNALNGLHKSRFFLLVTLLFYTGAVFLWRNLAFFLPLLYYDVVVVEQGRPTRGSLIFVPLFLAAAACLPKNAVFMTALLTAGSMGLAQRSLAWQASQRETRELRDRSWEMTTILKEKNRELLEKQDYGVHLAKLRERGRIAREIHDHVGHLLSRSLLQIGALLVTEENAKRQEDLRAVRATLSQAMDRIRLSVHGLYEGSLDLKSRVEVLVQEFAFCAVRLDYKLVENPSPEIENCFLAVIKEGLTNIARHSNATQVVLALTEHPAFYQLVLQDNGTEFKKRAGDGLGLRSMAYRAESLGGRFVADQAGGFRLFISIPKGGSFRAGVNN